MACVIKRERVGTDGKWQAVVRVKRRRFIESFDTREQAERVANEVEAQFKKAEAAEKRALAKQRKSDPVQVDFLSMKLRDVLLEFANDIDPRPEPVDGKRKRGKRVQGDDIVEFRRGRTRSDGTRPPRWRGIFNTVFKHVGEVRVADAKRYWVSLYVKKMRKTSHPRGEGFEYVSIRDHLLLMNAACRHVAMKLDIENPPLHFSPAGHFPKNWRNRRDRRVEPEEHQLIMAQLCKDRSGFGRQRRLLYRLAMETGARMQELILAQWKEMSKSGKVWTIPALHNKTAESRMVSLTSRARRVLQALRAMKDERSPFIFHRYERVKDASKDWAEQVESAGVENLTFHDLRHEGVCRLTMHPDRPPMTAVMKMVGHKSAEMTQLYANLRERDFERIFK